MVKKNQIGMFLWENIETHFSSEPQVQWFYHFDGSHSSPRRLAKRRLEAAKDI